MALSWWGKGLWQICMHHWRVNAKVGISKISTKCQNQEGKVNHLSHVQAKSELKNFRWHPGQSDWGVNHLSTFDPELRNVNFALISFMGFPAILSALQPFQICIFKRKYSKLTFSNGSQLMGKRFVAHLHAS